MKSPLEGTCHPDFIAPEIPGMIHILNAPFTGIDEALVRAAQFYNISINELWAEPFQNGYAVYSSWNYYGAVAKKIEEVRKKLEIVKTDMEMLEYDEDDDLFGERN